MQGGMKKMIRAGRSTNSDVSLVATYHPFRVLKTRYPQQEPIATSMKANKDSDKELPRRAMGFKAISAKSWSRFHRRFRPALDPYCTSAE
jgi:hypothetical protein